MAVRETSRAARAGQSELRLAARQAEILRRIRDGRPRVLCRKQIAQAMGVPFHALSSAFTALKQERRDGDGTLLRPPLIWDEGPEVEWDGTHHAGLFLTAAGEAALEGRALPRVAATAGKDAKEEVAQGGLFDLGVELNPWK